MPFDRSKYPVDWPQIRARILARAGHRCECSGECDSAHDGGRCNAPNGASIVRHAREPARWVRGDAELDITVLSAADLEAFAARPVIRVVITVAHLDHDPSHGDPARLRAFCQRCHLRLDRYQHAASARATRRRRRALGDLPGVR